MALQQSLGRPWPALGQSEDAILVYRKAQKKKKKKKKKWRFDMNYRWCIANLGNALTSARSAELRKWNPCPSNESALHQPNYFLPSVIKEKKKPIRRCPQGFGASSMQAMEKT